MMKNHYPNFHTGPRRSPWGPFIKPTTSTRTWLLVLLAMAATRMPAQNFAPRVNYGQRLEPVGNVVMHAAGQSNYTSFGADYLGQLPGDVPSVFMVYATVSDLKGPEWYARQNAGLAATETADRYFALQIGLWLGDGPTDRTVEEYVLMARQLKAWGRPVYLRIGYEFNIPGRFVPALYAAEFRDVYNALRQVGADNVATVWCGVPYNTTQLDAYYPGDQYVDWIGVDIFKPGEINSTQVQNFMNRANAARKPFLVGEASPWLTTDGTGIATLGQTAVDNWFAPYFALIRDSPVIKQFCYINWNWTVETGADSRKYGDCRFTANPQAEAFYRNEMTNPLYLDGGGKAYIFDQLGLSGNRPVDVTAPSAPADLVSPAQTTTSLQLAWSAATDDVGVTGYEVFVNSAFAAVTAGTGYTLSELPSGTTYTIAVRARDAAGNASPFSTPLTVATQKAIPRIVHKLTPLADAYVQEGSPATNYGSAASLVVKGETSGANNRRTYLKFDVSAVSGPVVSAKLRLYGNNTESNTSVIIAAFPASTDDWPENTLTWQAAPGAGGPEAGNVGVNRTAKYYELDITAFVQGQVTGDKIASLLLRNATNQNQRVDFRSKENPGSRPELVIEVADTIPPTAPAAVQAVPFTATQVKLNWEPSTDNLEVEGYYVFVNGAPVGDVPGAATTTFTASGLAPETHYSFTVQAVDGTGNLSAASDPDTLTTPAARVRLASVCSANPDLTRRWRVVNYRDETVHFTWQLFGTAQTGTGTVVPGDSAFVETPTLRRSPNILTITYGEAGKDTRGSTAEVCPNPAPAGSARVGLKELAQASEGFTLVPNPARNLLRVRLATPADGRADISVQTLTNRTLRRLAYSPVPGAQEATLAVDDFPSGMYLVQVRQAGRVFVKKLLISR